MNEKIRLLAEQAGLRFTMLTSNPMIPVVDGRQTDLQKFAELIIRQHLIVWEMMDNGNKVSGYVEMEDYPKAIINHFGIK